MAIGIEENGNLLIHPDHPMYHQIRCGSTPSTPEAAARSSPGFPIQQSPMFGCKTGKVVCHLSIFLLIGALLCMTFMLFRSTKLLASVSNSTGYHFSQVSESFMRRMSRTADHESCAKPEATIDTPYTVSYVTIDDHDKAERLACLLVERRLAACVNIIPKITSVYRWEGKVTKDDEVLMMIKSRQSRLDELTNIIKENHPYQVCEVISVPIKHGNPAYLEWLGKEVSDVDQEG